MRVLRRRRWATLETGFVLGRGRNGHASSARAGTAVRGGSAGGHPAHGNGRNGNGRNGNGRNGRRAATLVHGVDVRTADASLEGLFKPVPPTATGRTGTGRAAGRGGRGPGRFRHDTG